MSIVDKSLRAPTCLADSTLHQTAVTTSLHIWELHVGTVQLFIVGPGPNAWLACSESCYSGQIGTDEERRIARYAVILLNNERLQDKDAGPDEIKDALQRAHRAYQLVDAPTPS